MCVCVCVLYYCIVDQDLKVLHNVRVYYARLRILALALGTTTIRVKICFTKTELLLVLNITVY